MYRLSNVFISDIVTGGNIFRNARLPIRREDEWPDHGVIFAENGTCKTTLLSFMFTVFCPEQRRFAQHLQSGGDKTLQQYLIPGRPALILMDLVRMYDAPLYAENRQEPGEHVVVGQLLYQHKNIAQRPDRFFFIARSPELFAEMPRQWDDLLIRPQPYNAVRDFLGERAEPCTSQKLWEEQLESIGLDPWLVDRQIDFARSEGGIKDAFRFKTEQEFIEFFLGCVTDMKAAKKLREETEANLQKMKDRPEKKRRLKAIRTLKLHLEAFDEAAGQWRRFRKAGRLCKERIGEASHLLAQAFAVAGQRMDAENTRLREVEEKKVETGRAVETVHAGLLKADAWEAKEEFRVLQEHVHGLGQEIRECEVEIRALEASKIIARHREIEAEVRMKDSALTQTHSEMAPVRQEVDLRAAQYHARLGHERRGIQENMAEISAERVQTQEALAQCLRAAADKQTEIQSEEKRKSALESRIRSAEDSREDLYSEGDESPFETSERLKREIVSIESRLEKIGEKIAETEGVIRSDKERRLRLQIDDEDAREKQRNTALQWEQEQAGRQRLLEDKNLISVAGTPDFDPTGASLQTRADDAVSRYQKELEEKEREARSLTEEIQWLSEFHTLAADRETMKLLTHYRQQGFTPAEIRAFPEYLSALTDDPETVAEYLKRDPGRFTGIMAASEEIIRKLASLPVPPFLRRPVMVSEYCVPDQVAKTPHHVISPEDPRSYSKEGADELERELREKKENLENILEKLRLKIDAWKESGQRLRDYRKKYPDQAAVEMLLIQKENAEKRLNGLALEIETQKAATEKRSEEKAALEKEKSGLSNDRNLCRERLKNVDKWLTRNAALEEWRSQVTEKEEVISDFNREMRTLRQKEAALKEQEQQIQSLLNRKEADLRELSYRAEDVPSSATADKLSAEALSQALSLSLQALKKLYESVLDTQRRKSSELGVEGLENELHRLQETLQEVKNDLERFQKNHSYPETLAEAWASKDRLEREERKDVLNALRDSHRDEKARSEVRLESLVKKQEMIGQQLTEMENRGIQPEIGEDELMSKGPDAFRRRLSEQDRRLRQTLAALEKDSEALQKRVKTAETYLHQLEIIRAVAKKYEAVWDHLSPRAEWPDVTDPDADVHTADAFRKQLDGLLEEETGLTRDLEASVREMNRFFDRLRNEIRDESFRKRIPDIMDKIIRHDTESLGEQCRELIENCDRVARNLEGGLSDSQEILENHIQFLLEHSRECYKKLQSASLVKIPSDVFIYGGKPILRSGASLDFKKTDDVFRRSLENWLEELMQENRCPQVNDRAGNCLGAELLYRLVKASGSREIFGIRLLKCDDTGRNYEPVGKDLGSGGEALTTAVLLYSLLVSMRLNRYQRKTLKGIPSFLILDNPLGVCNRPDFLDAQLKVAKALGIQCVYLTGIHDTGPMELFEHRLVIRKAQKQLLINDKSYNLLEIIEMNVER